ncbi:MAG: hypothetical protein D6785_06355 [Planctomycetota bacterium]|nr:MAG: hypothetical protein D6785_06355 [Planctomycetota bacterium]
MQKQFILPLQNRKECLKTCFWAILFLFLLVIPFSIFGDEIIDRRNGHTWKGKILKDRSNKKWVVLKLLNGGIMRFPRNYVKIIEDDNKLPPFTFGEGKKNNRESAGKSGKDTNNNSNKKDSSFPKKKLDKNSNNGDPLSLTGNSKQKDTTIVLPKPEGSFQSNEEESLPPLASQGPPTFWNYLMSRPLWERIFLGSVVLLFLFTLFWKLLF